MHDPHRHMGGSISCSTVANIKNITLKEATELMTYTENDNYSYESFFDKFKILDDIQWDYKLIDLTIQDVIWGLKKEKLSSAEIKFSVNKYIKYINDDIDKIILWMIYQFEKHSSNWGIHVDPILSLKHEMDKNLQLKIANCIKNDSISEFISGIDIVGNENYFDADFYKPIFETWNDAGKACMAHVGEINRPDNVKNAILKLPIDRICHGIAVANDSEIASISRDKNIVFDLCLTSNFYTGVVQSIEDHPVNKMLENGFLITVGTDDPVVLNTTINKEYEILKKITTLNNDEIENIKLAAPQLSAKEIIKRKNSKIH